MEVKKSAVVLVRADETEALEVSSGFGRVTKEDLWTLIWEDDLVEELQLSVPGSIDYGKGR